MPAVKPSRRQKGDGSKVSEKASFKDMGLDSLDAAEAGMASEEGSELDISDADDYEIRNDDGRLQMRSDINMEGPAYVGKKSSRSAVFESTDEKKLVVMQNDITDHDEDDDDDEDGDDDLHLLGNVDNDLDREYEELRKQEEELVNQLKRKRTDDQGKGDSVRHQKVLWDRALEMRIPMQKLVSGANQLPEMQGKLGVCKSDSQCEKAYDSLTKSAVAALDCFLELKDALIEQNPAIAEADASTVDGEKPGKKIKSKGATENSSSDSLWNRMDAMYSSITPYRNSSVDRWQRKTQLATGAAAVKGRFQAFNQSISQQLVNALRNPAQLIESIRSSQSKEQHTPGLVDNGAASVAASDVTNEEASTADVQVVDDSEFYQQLLVEFLESSNPSGLGGIQRRQHRKKRKVVDRRASKGRKIRYNVLEPLVNFMAPEPMELPPIASQLFINLFGQRKLAVS